MRSAKSPTSGYQVFLDLELHDIPNTVAKAVESAAKLPIGMLTLHTCGGREMMQWAVKAQRDHAPNLRLLGVTVLTSMSAPGLAETGVVDSPEKQVVRLGRLAAEAGLRGLVCSPLEIAPLRSVLPAEVQLVTPGIRPRDAKADDQTRIMTPGEAARAGANFLVVGRPILKAPRPVAAARAILAGSRMSRTAAILLAAGSGTRMAGAVTDKVLSSPTADAPCSRGRPPPSLRAPSLTSTWWCTATSGK
jgi:orotidine-5'-phosphate decarboxylase